VTHLEFGYPSRHICECADKNEVDLIILGSRGLRGVERILMGSVATEVANHTSRNIMIVK
jgi:nucleotide-binding universal stress UspA family protein